MFLHLVEVTENWRETDPLRFPSGSVFEAWIPISERFTEVLGKSQEGMRGRGKGNVKNKGNPRTVGSELRPYYPGQDHVVFSHKDCAHSLTICQIFQHLFGSRMFISIYIYLYIYISIIYTEDISCLFEVYIPVS